MLVAARFRWHCGGQAAVIGAHSTPVLALVSASFDRQLCAASQSSAASFPPAVPTSLLTSRSEAADVLSRAVDSVDSWLWLGASLLVAWRLVWWHYWHSARYAHAGVLACIACRDSKQTYECLDLSQCNLLLLCVWQAATTFIPAKTGGASRSIMMPRSPWVV